MWPFKRRPKGKHALGAAVTAIPSAAPARVTVVPPPVAAEPVVAEPAAVESVVVAEPVAAPAPEPVVPAAPVAVEPVAVPAQVLHPEPAPGMRVELGFRDGSTAALAPNSAQAKALTDIADILTKRD